MLLGHVSEMKEAGKKDIVASANNSAGNLICSLGNVNT
jgi:hypothetical protein